ncbi:hypothetical protein Poly30_12810 [Planctomycetes bacterium Poly30]|uniref:Tellurite resistance protein TerB n=1 Tax=Saltatorellus ferox TaxID=2528018 RepID=A0A518ENW9_9BACT|nr:hypothetical protein Poly30_12810 [Planctomycetes bacterium Poly30]
MTTATYSSLEPLISSKEVRGTSVSVVFTCPETGVEVPSTGSLKRSSTVKSQATRSVKKNLWSSLRRSVTSAVADALGNGAAGRIARDVANSSMAQAEQKTAFSKEEVQEGVVGAFTAVQAKFKHNPSTGAWTAIKKPANGFEKRLAEAPVTERFDQGVLARALVELSAADGEISADEVAFIADFIDPELGTVEDFARRDKLTPAELSETSEAVRGSIMMLAWACAMSDEELADAEVARLEELSTGFGLSAEQSSAVRNEAQQFLFEQALGGVYAGGQRNDEAFQAAKEAAGKMGIDEERVTQMDASYRKLAGIV